ncbi:MAG: ABC transporter permease [Clostridiales bacterium]|nr:ABC transporter permease [Clostridiales bacterium]
MFSINALELGLIFSIMTMGVFVSLRILNIPDLSVDGSIVLGLAVSSYFTIHGMPILGIFLSFFAGTLAGAVTGLLITKMKIQPILAGILTMTALYTVNFRIMGRPNLDLPVETKRLGNDYYTIFTPFEELLGKDWHVVIVVSLIVLIIAVLLYLFMKTQIGISLRATGDNEHMVRATSINADGMKVLGLALANGLVSLSGGIWAHQQQTADISNGLGMLVASLAAIIIGEVIFKKTNVISGILAAISGIIIYRYIYSIALTFGLRGEDLKLITAVIVVGIIGIKMIRFKDIFAKLGSGNGGGKNA